MDNKSDEQFLVMKATIEVNRQNYEDKMKKLIEDLKAMITSTITSTMSQMDISKSSQD